MSPSSTACVARHPAKFLTARAGGARASRADRNMKGSGTLRGALIAVLVIGLAAAAAKVGTAEPSLTLLYVYPPSYITTSLGEFTVDVNVFNVSNLQGFEFRLGYNATILDVTGVTEGSFLTSIPNVTFTFHSEEYPVEGYVRVYANIVSGGPANGTGTLATVTFNATYGGAASCVLDLYDTALTDPQGGLISHEVADGYYEFVVLSLTVMTGKPPPPANYAQGYYGQLYWRLHYVDDWVYLYGNLTASEREGGLVALQVVDPGGRSRVYRTLQTGPNPPAGGVAITALYPSDKMGNPASPPVFTAGSLEGTADPAHFTVTVENSGTATVDVTVVINLYDSSGRPIGWEGFTWGLEPGTQVTSIEEVLLSKWVSNGNGTVYASVFTGDPSAGGVPYCPERSTWFTITGGTDELLGGTTEPAGIVADYNLSFRLHHSAWMWATFSWNQTAGWTWMGNYTVYVSSTYRGAHVEEATTFISRVQGDASGDGRVTGTDLAILGRNWYKSYTDPTFDPRVDFNLDGRCTGSDLAILGRNWYRYPGDP